MSTNELLKLQNQLNAITEVVSDDLYNLGDKFFEKIVTKLNKTLSADYTFIGKLNKEGSEIKTVALVSKQGLIENFSYNLKGTPCENVVGQNACSYADHVTDLFPRDQLLIDMEIEAYVGVPLYNSKSHPTGILVSLFKNKIEDTFTAESILMIFASRAGAEIEHQLLYKELDKHKKELERKVRVRTKELEGRNTELRKTLHKLKKTQAKLVESEKMASLGILTAGVAHEINNPLNFILGGYTGLKNYLEENNISNNQVDTLLECISTGVERSSKIVNSLNNYSRTENRFDDKCNIHSIIDESCIMLNHKLKDRVKIQKNYTTEPVILYGNLGKLIQAFLNIIQNAQQAIKEKGFITINTELNNDIIKVEIKDSGSGINSENLYKITTPFYTTKQPGEGTGLGLSITSSIIKEHKGSLEFKSEINKGTTVTIYLPKKIKN